jgi:hypothetical protein
VRAEISGSEDALDPGAFAASIGSEIDRLSRDGSLLVLVLHLSLLDWLGAERLGELLDLASSARETGLCITRCREVGELIAERSERFEGGTELDPRTWSAG